MVIEYNLIPIIVLDFEKLIDGRFARYGFFERITKSTTPGYRCLSNGDTFLWLHVSSGTIRGFRVSGSNAPHCYEIVDILTEVFNVQWASEYDPEYYGLETMGELDWLDDQRDPADEGYLEDYGDEIYRHMMKYCRGEKHRLGKGSIWIIKAEIAKQLIDGNPNLASLDAKDELMRLTDDLYQHGHVEIGDGGYGRTSVPPRSLN